MIVEVVPPAALAEVRSAALREGREPVVFPEDDDPTTLHLAALDGGGTVVGVASFIDQGDGVWQLRGMGVQPGRQGGGIGRLLLDEGLRRLRAAGARHLWANGRDVAQPFYERAGFRVVGDGYEMVGVPHHRIELDL